MKKRFTKILSVILAMLMLCAAVPMAASAADIVESGTCVDSNVTWTIDSDGLLTFFGIGYISCAESFTTDRVAPGIGNINHERCNRIKSVFIPVGITDIHYQAFDNCTSLEKITVDKNNDFYLSDDGVLFNKDKTVLSKYPCADTRNHYTVPESIEIIADCAFDGAHNLKSVKLPDSLKVIDWGAFRNCGVESLVIPENVTIINNYAFKESSLKEITIPASVNVLSDTFAFTCDSLEKINVSPDNVNFSSKDGVLFNKDKTRLIHYPAGKTDKHYVIPETVTHIAEFAFDMANNLYSIVIPAGVVEIGTYAFRGTYINHIGYTGSIDMWKQIDTGNDDTFDINILIEKYDIEMHYNFDPEKDFEINENEYYFSVKCSCGFVDMISIKECSHMCHKTGFVGFFWKIINFLQRIFGTGKYCACGAAHY